LHSVTPIKLRLRELRERKGWSQAKLGRLAGVSASTINRAERGETRTLSLGNLEKLATALGVQPGSLLRRT
jgi:transcriptional regulator with XRE-family HTH domain